MSHRVVWIVGEPGSGKTTIARALLGPLGRCRLLKSPKWTVSPDRKIVAAGHYTGGPFDGADTVPYSGVREAIEVWRHTLRPGADLTILDGDRFSYGGAVEQIAQPEVELCCLYVCPPAHVAEKRRLDRAQAAGTKLQNANWVKGRATKAAGFATSREWDRYVRLDPQDRTPDQLSAIFETLLAFNPRIRQAFYDSDEFRFYGANNGVIVLFVGG